MSNIRQSTPRTTIDSGPSLDRRRLLFWGVAGTCAAAPIPALAAPSPRRERALSFYNLHTGEQLRTVYWADGKYLAQSLGEITYLLRDFRTGETKAIDRHLLDTLHRLRQAMASREPFHVISGYRSPKTNQKLRDAGHGVAKKSLHMRGMAIDIRLPGRELKGLYKAARSLRAGGVGYYAKSNFVHVDVGRVRYW